MLTGLAPLVSEQTRLVILGSFPSAASLAAGQYYAHPRNQFWPLVSSLLALTKAQAREIVGSDYPARCAWLLSRGVGLWDVYAACERQGSLDAAIRQAQVNDFAGLSRRCPRLQAIGHNGAESFKYAPQVAAAWTGAASPAPVFYKLPSSSPAHAAWSLERKLAAWREVFEQQGLIE